MGMSFAHSHSINYDRLRRVMSYDCLRQVMMCLAAQFEVTRRSNVHEAQYAQGTKDFISKFEIALKECNESEYWLELLYDTNGISDEDFAFFQKTCVELRRMLVSSVTTLKNK